MIYTNVVITVKGDTSGISNPILLFRGDRNLEISFQIEQQNFKFAKSDNMILSTNASFGQLVIEKPDGSKVLSDITECDDGKIIFMITKDMIDELDEVGYYDIQIRLYDDIKMARITIPPVSNAIEVKEPMMAEDYITPPDETIFFSYDETNQELLISNVDIVYDAKNEELIISGLSMEEE